MSSEIDSLREVLSRQPENVRARVDLGRSLQTAGRLEEALTEFGRIRDAAPADPRSHYNVAAVLHALGERAEALQVLGQAIRKSPEEALLHYGTACVLQSEGRADDAQAAYARTIDLDPDHANAWYGLGTVFHGLGDMPRAMSCFDNALALQDDHAAARHMHNALANQPAPQPPGDFVRNLFDSYAEHFDEHLLDGLRYRAPRLVADALAELLSEAQSLQVLDLGCGTGLSGASLRKFAESLAGVDVSAAMLARAKTRGCYDRLDQADIADYLDGAAVASLDLLAAVDVFIYVGDLERVLERASRVLRRGGMLAFTVETADGNGVTLSPNGRYRHSSHYLEGLRAKYAYRELVARRKIIRYEARRPCWGMIVIWEI